MSELPRGWAWAALGDLGAEIKVSVTPQAGTAYELYSVPAFANLAPEVVDGSTIGSAKRAVAPDDVLLCKINPRINRVWIVGQARGLTQVASPEYLILRTTQPGLARYLRWYLSSPPFREWIKLSVEGMTGSHTRAKSGPILRQLVPVPPLAEQRRIVVAIEEHLSRLDAGQAALENGAERLSPLRRGIGASNFRQQWATRPLAELVDPERPIRYGILMPKEHVEDGVLYVRVRDFPEGRIQVDELKRTSPDIAHQYRRASLQPGDVLVSIRGTFGRVAIVPPELDGANITQDSARIAPLSEIDRGYLVSYLRSERAQQFFRSVARGVAVRGVNLGDLREMPIPVAPPEEQKRVASEVERQMSLLDALSSEIEHARRRSERLRRALLIRAFRGELVPQELNDEPASVLLKRIAAERAAVPKPTRKRTRKTTA